MICMLEIIYVLQMYVTSDMYVRDHLCVTDVGHK